MKKRCPACDGTGESEFRTNCWLCDFACTITLKQWYEWADHLMRELAWMSRQLLDGYNGLAEPR